MIKISIVSFCEKSAIKKTHAILDRYAIRSGNQYWSTSITMEGLNEMHRLIKSVATRQTSVACYLHKGVNNKNQQLLWVVGNRKKISDNRQAVIATRKKDKELLTGWKRCVCLLAKSSGLIHDIGKFNNFFQMKLRANKIIADDIRHEWISMSVLRDRYKQVEKKNISSLFGESINESIATNFRNHVFIDGDNAAMESLSFIVATHHRMLDANDYPSYERHAKDYADKKEFATNESYDFKRIDNNLNSVIKRVSGLSKRYPQYNKYGWRLISTVARACMVLADQYVSSLDVTDKNLTSQMMANTVKNEKGNRVLNQTLEYHLNRVAADAAEIAHGLLTWEPPCLDQRSIKNIIKRSDGPSSRFYWQDTAYDAIKAVTQENDCPAIIFNIAGTGAGKTRMNAKAIIAANRDGNVRFSSALNLKSLTLQTGDAYLSQLKMTKENLSIVIGDISAKKLYEQSKRSSDFIDEDGNIEEPDYDYLSYEKRVNEAWLDNALKGRGRIGDVITSPVLVSTIDWIIAAGECGLQGTHAISLIRSMTADIIIDEVDGYDVDAMTAVLRLVMLAGAFGRNVVASSATLSKHVAYSIFEHYKAGAKMMTGCEAGRGQFCVAFISDQIDHCVSMINEKNTFVKSYDDYIKRLTEKLKTGKKHRLANLINVTGRSQTVKDYCDFMIEPIRSLHQSNANLVSGKMVSFGLIRVANIKVALNISRIISTTMNDVKVCCYHSNLTKIKRYSIERRLDYLLSRGSGDEHIHKDKEILDIVNNAKGENVIFLVVATPVEEIGRDHDFDWAIIEPSSTQSIVQTAGRVNRHRLMEVDRPNISILQRNFMSFSNGLGKQCFTRPGYEMSDNIYTEHELDKLINFDDQGMVKVDASIRLDGQHLFANLDDNSIELGLAQNTECQLGIKESRSFTWYSDISYENKVRQNNISTRLFVKGDEVAFFQKNDWKEEKIGIESLSVDITSDSASAWLHHEESELEEMAREARISIDDAFSVSVSQEIDDTKTIYVDKTYGLLVKAKSKD